MSALRVGVVGCGVISGTYLKNRSLFEAFEIVAVSDLVAERARAAAKEHGIEKVLKPDELMAAGDIDLVLNLTLPAAHAEVGFAALEAGKHVYSEKPLATKIADGERLVRTARDKGLHLGCAPDTFMGAGIQTARHILDSGMIGRPLAASAFMVHRGPERFHPAPDFFYQAGGGPLFDMGPYFLATLVDLLGPIRRVCASACAAFSERTITYGPRFGEAVPVETPTHLAGVLDFHSGVVATLVTSFDVWRVDAPAIQVYGTEGSLVVPHPNVYCGPVEVRMREEPEAHLMPITHRYAQESRGLGLDDMAIAIVSGRPHRANGDLALHVLEVMEAFHDSSRENRHVETKHRCERPAPMPPGLGPAIVPGLV